MLHGACGKPPPAHSEERFGTWGGVYDIIEEEVPGDQPPAVVVQIVQLQALVRTWEAFDVILDDAHHSHELVQPLQAAQHPTGQGRCFILADPHLLGNPLQQCGMAGHALQGLGAVPVGRMWTYHWCILNNTQSVCCQTVCGFTFVFSPVHVADTRFAQWLTGWAKYNVEVPCFRYNPPLLHRGTKKNNLRIFCTTDGIMNPLILKKKSIQSRRVYSDNTSSYQTYINLLIASTQCVVEVKIQLGSQKLLFCLCQRWHLLP